MSVLHTKLRRDLLRRRAQVLAVVVTIVLGVALYGATFDAYRNLEASYQRTYDRLALADLTISGGQVDAIAADARATDGVADVAQRTQAEVPLRIDQHRLFGRAVGMPTEGQPTVDAVDVVQGSGLDPSRPDGVLVEQHLADAYGLGPGDQLQVVLGDGPTTVEVLGVAVSAEYLWPARSRQELFTSADDFGVLFVPEPLADSAPPATSVAQVLVRYAPGADAGALDAQLTARARDLGAGDVVTQADQPSNAALQEDVAGFGELALLFPLLFLGAAGMATFTLLTRLVQSQRAQIGTLEANGLARGTVLRHYLSYGVVTGLVGAALGAVLGVVLGRLTTGAYTSSLSIPDTVVRFHPLTPIVGLAFGLVAGLAAAWAPARRALRVAPAEALRGDVPTSGGRRSLVERLVPPLGHLPVRWRMTLRGIGRSRRRSASTVLGVVLALVLVLASWGMVDTTEVLVARQFDVIDTADAQVLFTTPLGGDQEQAVADVDGVADVERSAQAPVLVAGGTGAYGTLLTGFAPGTTMHTFLAPDGTEVPLPDQGVLVGQAMADLLGVGVGDAVTLTLPTLGTTVSTEVAGFVDEPLGTPAYVALPELADLLAAGDPAVAATTLGAPGVGSLLVRYAAGADAPTVSTALEQLTDVAVVVDARSLYDTVQGLLGFFYAFVGVMLLFGGVMAFALIFNTLSVNVAERTVELATMRANGFGLGGIARLLTGENLLLVAVGIAIGLPVGLWVAGAFLASFSSDLFQLDLQVRTRTLVVSAGAMVVVSLLSQLPGIRTIGRLDLGEVVRERSQ